MITNKDEQTLEVLFQTLKANCPFDTGRLAASIEKSFEDNSILIGGETADYAVYTNEPWENGKRNPNQGWVQQSIELAKPIIQEIYKGNITQEELNNYLSQQNQIYQDKVNERIKGIEEEKNDI